MILKKEKRLLKDIYKIQASANIKIVIVMSVKLIEYIEEK